MIPKPLKPKAKTTSLLNCLGKLLYIIKSLCHQNSGVRRWPWPQINTWQRAYQPQKEANKHIHIINQYLKQAKRSKRTTALLLIDIEKTCDAIWHNGLLKNHPSKDWNKPVRKGQPPSRNATRQHPQSTFLPSVNNIPTTPPSQCTQYADDIGIYTSHWNMKYLKTRGHGGRVVTNSPGASFTSSW